MSAETLKRMNPMSKSAVEKAQSEDMELKIVSADNGQAEITVHNHEKGSKHTITVNGGHVMCDCPAKRFHCDPEKNENCKHEVFYAVRAP